FVRSAPAAECRRASPPPTAPHCRTGHTDTTEYRATVVATNPIVNPAPAQMISDRLWPRRTRYSPGRRTRLPLRRRQIAPRTRTGRICTQGVLHPTRVKSEAWSYALGYDLPGCQQFPLPPTDFPQPSGGTA